MRELNDCGPKISKEHPISRNVLRQIATNGKLFAGGYEGQEKETLELVGINNLSDSILCKRHNESLNWLDTAIGNFSSALHEFDADLRGGAPKPDLRVVCGEDIERWALKATIGLVVSNAFATPLPQNCVRLLYGIDPWPPGWGLYLEITGAAPVVYHTTSVSIQSFIHPETSAIMGVRFEIAGFPLALLLATPANPGSIGLYRPRTIACEGHGVRKFVEICWQDPMNVASIEYNFAGTYNGDHPNQPKWKKKQKKGPPPPPP